MSTVTIFIALFSYIMTNLEIIEAICNTNLDCQLNGLCVDSKCICDKEWTGNNCGKLNVGVGFKAYDPENIDQDFEYIANKLGISVETLRSYFDAPNKTYKDYKNQQSLYKIGSKVMRLLRLELGGKR